MTLSLDSKIIPSAAYYIGPMMETKNVFLMQTVTQFKWLTIKFTQPMSYELTTLLMIFNAIKIL